jgi:hypothetical protein
MDTMSSMRMILAAGLVAGAVATSAGLAQTRAVPAGTVIDLGLRTALDSATTNADQRFEATVLTAIESAGQTLVESGAVVRGFVGSVGGLRGQARQAQITLAFTEIDVAGRAARLRATVVDVLDPKRLVAPPRPEIGPVVGGRRDAQLAGVRVRDGGTVVSTEGGDVKLPAGAVLRVRLDAPIAVSAGR